MWVQSINRTQRKIGDYSFASQPFTSRVMSTIIVHANPHPISHICQDLSNTRCLPKDKMKKGKVEITLTLAQSKRHKVKDRPFVEGSRGCHALLGLDTQNLNAKECHFIFPLVYGPLLCSPSLLLLP